MTTDASIDDADDPEAARPPIGAAAGGASGRGRSSLVLVPLARRSARGACGSGGSSTRPATPGAVGRGAASTTAGASRASATSSRDDGVIGSSLVFNVYARLNGDSDVPGRHLRAAARTWACGPRSTALEGRARASTTPSSRSRPGSGCEQIADRVGELPGRDARAVPRRRRATTRCARRSSPRASQPRRPAVARHVQRSPTPRTRSTILADDGQRRSTSTPTTLGLDERRRRRATRRTTSSRSRR